MDWTKLADEATIERTVAALKKNNMTAEVVADKEQALERLVKLIPDGSEVMTAGSTSLDQIGFTEVLKSGNHKWINLKKDILAEKNPDKQKELRRHAATADYSIGSVHAITEEGNVLIASGSGSQLPGYAFSSPKVIWIVGSHKIVKDMESGLKRVREHSLPLEDARMKSVGYGGSFIAKMLVINKELMPERIHVIIVKEVLGF